MNIGPINFLAPGAFALGLLLPVIVAFYLLKLRRIEQNVPSVYLWRRMVRDVEANAPWQKLRFNLLMLLQLLFLAFLILALTRPFTWAEGASGEAAIFILDTSASMAATDMAPTRLEAAKQRARQLVDDLPDTSRVTIIEAGREALVRLSSSLDRRQAHLAIENMRTGTGGSDLAVALELASAIAARQPGTEIVVFSDGQVSLPDRVTLRGRLRYMPMGLTDNNQAVSLLTLEPTAGGSSLTAFAQVSNYGQETANRRLEIYADQLLVYVQDLVDIPAGGTQAALVDGLPLETQVIEARLDGGDALPLDDSALAVQPKSEPVPVTLISDGNLFIKTALSLLPGVILNEVEAGGGETDETATSAPTAQPAPDENGISAPGLTIYDNTIPDTLAPSGSLLFIAPTRSTEFFTVTGSVELIDSELLILDPNDPLVMDVSLSGVSVLETVEIPLPDWALPVVGGDTGEGTVPLLFRGEINGRRIAVLAFDLHNSDLPLNIAFPLMWANLIDWLAPGARSEIPARVAPGDSLSFTAPDGAPTAAIQRPDFSQVEINAESGRFVFAETDQLGLYRVNFADGSSSSFTVNLFSPQESNVNPADALPGLESESAEGGANSQQGQREWWRPLAFLALGLLVGEWLVYQRAGLIRFRDMLLGRSNPRPASARPRTIRRM